MTSAGVERAARALAAREPLVCASVLGAESTLDGARHLAAVVLAAAEPPRYAPDPLAEARS